MADAPGKTRRVPLEVRLEYRRRSMVGPIGWVEGGGLWFPDSPAARSRIILQMAAGNRYHGDATHWMAIRPA